MKAVVLYSYGGPEVLQVEEVPEPQPETGEVLIQTKAASINFADIKLRSGGYFLRLEPPLTPGMDLAGEVIELGQGVADLVLGQRVAAHVGTGAYAERVVASAELTWPLPDTIDFETGAAFPTVGITSDHLLMRVTGLQPGETILIHAAAGGVGSVCVQLARRLGADRIFGTVGSGEKAKLISDLGCDEVILYRQEPFAEEVQKMTAGRGVDVILDSIGGVTFSKSLDCLANSGRIAVFGMASGRPGQTTTDLLHHTNRAVIGYSLSDLRSTRPVLLRHAGDRVLEQLRTGRLGFVIGARFSLSEAAEAHRFIESRKSVGKVILLPSTSR